MKSFFYENLSKDVFCLKYEQIDIWQFSLLQLPDGAIHLLNEEEQMRAKRFYFPEHRRRFTVARAMLRTILAKYLQEDPAKLSFSYNQYGKPFLADKCSMEFNLSHSGELALLAVGKNYPLGVDIEYFSKRPYDDIGKNLFSEQEVEALSNQKGANKERTFFRIWSQKEAFIKANGMGLAYPTQQFSVHPRSEDIEIYDAIQNQTWKMISFKPDKRAAGALCFSPHVKILRKIHCGTELLPSPGTIRAATVRKRKV